MLSKKLTLEKDEKKELAKELAKKRHYEPGNEFDYDE